MIDPLEKIGMTSETDVRRITERQGLIPTPVERATPQNHNSNRREGDQLSISQSASLLTGNGINKSDSVFNVSSNRVDFNLSIQSDKFNEMRARGSFDPVRNRLDFSVTSLLEGVTFDTDLVAEKYSAQMRASVSHPQSSGSGDLQHSLNGLMQELVDAATSKQYPPRSVVVNLADLADLVTDGGAFRRVTNALMFLNRTLAKAMSGEQDSGVQNEDLVNKTKNEDGKQAKKEEVKHLTFNIQKVETPVPDKAPEAPAKGPNQSVSE